jgi:type IV pilus assembly protein PilY1
MVRHCLSKRSLLRALQITGLLVAFGALLTGQHLATAQSGGDSALAQTPLFVSESYPPLNMLVMARDHKLYYEAYNDASDLDGDGVIDVGYKPDQIDYYGYFNNNACYTYEADVFKPTAAASGSKNKHMQRGDLERRLPELPDHLPHGCAASRALRRHARASQ